MQRMRGANLVSKQLITVACAVLLFGIAAAHHSRSNYKMREFLEYDGTVVEFAWKNPHAFAVIEIIDASGSASRLLLEMNSKPILSSMGWTAESLAVGDRIHVRGNPDRRADRPQLFVAYIINRDDEKLWSFGRPRDEKERYEKANPVQRVPLIGSKDFSGIWSRARLTDAQRARSNPFGPAPLPLTAKGDIAASKFDPNDDPAFECLANTLPQTIVPVYPLQITWLSDELLRFDYEFNNGYREVHLNQPDFPTDLDPTRMGYSIGRIEDSALVIRTRRFSYDRWGNGRGVPSGENKEVYERYNLANEGKRMEVMYVVTDLDYVKGPPLVYRGAYVLRNNIELSNWDCDPNAAVRHLTGE